MTDRSPHPLHRRTLLRATAVLPAAGVAAAGSTAVAATPAQADAPGRAGRFDSESPRFTLAVLPDTQYLFDADSADPAPLAATFRHLVGERSTRNIAFMTHLGDVTEHGTEDEITRAAATFRTIHGKVPYSVLAGNHDISSGTDDQRGDTAYLAAFGPARYASMPTFRGASPDGYNSYHVLRAAGREWLVLALDWRVSDKGLSWAQGVLDAHPTLPAVLTTHDIAWADDDGKAQLSDNGTRLWDGLIRGNDQIFLALGGHYWPPGRTVLTNDADNDVHVHITNYQDRYYGGAAMIRTYRFDMRRDTIDVSTFSPWIRGMSAGQVNELAGQERELTSPVDRFSMAIDFDRRFNAFAPVPPRPARPAKKMLTRDTLAYWRFDGGGADGSAIADGQVIRDLTGRGNDLVKQNVSGTPGTPLAWSTTEFHPDQPGHGSLRFTGQGHPVQGAWLQTVPNAPLNAETFQHGYTFEMFFKLPADWDSSQSAWSGLLSRWGMASEAGKSGGNTDPQEPIVTLSLSGGSELQWNVYPLNQPGASTAWSHLLPLGTWWHVAAVNDGKVNRLYVNGCEEGRNPSTPAIGLTTLNHSWLLGGYEYAGAINQIHNGWIGDVRITGRPLRTDEFMNA